MARHESSPAQTTSCQIQVERDVFGRTNNSTPPPGSRNIACRSHFSCAGSPHEGALRNYSNVAFSSSVRPHGALRRTSWQQLSCLGFSVGSCVFFSRTGACLLGSSTPPSHALTHSIPVVLVLHADFSVDKIEWKQICSQLACMGRTEKRPEKGQLQSQEVHIGERFAKGGKGKSRRFD